jgi:hypothetical protein
MGGHSHLFSDMPSSVELGIVETHYLANGITIAAFLEHFDNYTGLGLRIPYRIAFQ